MTLSHCASERTSIFSSIETYGSECLILIFHLPEVDIKIKCPDIAINILLNRLKHIDNFSTKKYNVFYDV